jgi:tetratricopeptide (TPR) repeat protein
VQAPDNVIALSAMGFVQHLRGHLTAADDNYRRAYNIDSSNADILHLYSLLLLGTGKVAEAEALRKKLQKMEPMVTVYIAFNIASAWVSGDSERAQKMLESTTLPIPPGHPFFVRLHALIYAARGKFREASQIVLKAAATYDPSIVQAASDLLLAAASGTDYQAPYLGFFSILHIYSKTPERALEYSQANRKAGFLPATESTLFWHRSKEFAALRSMEGFRALMRDTNFVDLWHSRGMPDLCRDGRGEDFCRL